MIVCCRGPTSGGHYETHLIAPGYADGSVISVVARWLGHESPATTHHYAEADLMMKERALSRLHELDVKTQRYCSPDSLIDFLKTL